MKIPSSSSVILATLAISSSSSSLAAPAGDISETSGMSSSSSNNNIAGRSNEEGDIPQRRSSMADQSDFEKRNGLPCAISGIVNPVPIVGPLLGKILCPDQPAQAKSYKVGTDGDGQLDPATLNQLKAGVSELQHVFENGHSRQGRSLRDHPRDIFRRQDGGLLEPVTDTVSGVSGTPFNSPISSGVSGVPVAAGAVVGGVPVAGGAAGTGAGKVGEVAGKVGEVPSKVASKAPATPHRRAPQDVPIPDTPTEDGQEDSPSTPVNSVNPSDETPQAPARRAAAPETPSAPNSEEKVPAGPSDVKAPVNPADVASKAAAPQVPVDPKNPPTKPDAPAPPSAAPQPPARRQIAEGDGDTKVGAPGGSPDQTQPADTTDPAVPAKGSA